jgi:hypothetical protein
MKKLTVISILCALMFLIINTAHAQKLSEKQKIKIENELEKVFEEALRDGEKLDVDRIASGVDDRRKAAHIVNGAYYSTFDSLMMVFTSGIRNTDRQEYSINKKKITALTKDLAIVSAAGKATVYLKTGQSFIAGFAWTFVYENTGSGWKVIHSHRSSPR